MSDDHPNPELAKRLNWILEHRNLNQTSLSDAAGLSQSVVGQLLRGEIKGSGTKSLAKIAEATKVNISWLIFGHGNPEDPVVMWQPSTSASGSMKPTSRGKRTALPPPTETEAPLDPNLEATVLRALEPGKHTLDDATAVKRILLESGSDATIGEDDVRAWLDAAALLRSQGRPVTAARLLTVMASKAPRRRR